MAITTKKYGTLNFDKNPVWSARVGESPYAVAYHDNNGTEYYFVPEDIVQKGLGDQSNNYYFSYFLDPKNINNFASKAEYMDLSQLPFSDVIKSKYGISGKGFLVPSSVGFDSGYVGVTPKSKGTITGLSFKDGQLVYALSGGAGTKYGWIDANNNTWVQPERHRSGGLRGFLERAGDALISAGPVIQLAAAISGNPLLYGLSAGTAAGQGNLLGAALNLTGMAGAIPGIDAATAADLKATQSVLQISAALKNDNPMAALSALGGLSGTALPSEVVRGAQLLAINDALEKGDMKSLAVAVGNISGTPELAYAGKAAKVLEAIDSGNINKVASSLNTLLPELKSAYKSTDFKQAFANVGADLTDDQFSKLDIILSSDSNKLVDATMAGIAEAKAQEEGWKSSSEQQQAQELGFATPAEYASYVANQQPEVAPEAPDVAQDTVTPPLEAQAVSALEGQTPPTEEAKATPTEEAPKQNVAQETTPWGGTSYLPAVEKSQSAETAVAEAAPTGGLPTVKRTRPGLSPEIEQQYAQRDPFAMPEIGIPGLSTGPSMLAPVDLTGQDQGTLPTSGTGQPGQIFNPGQVQELGQLFGSLAPEMKNVLLQRGNVSPDIVQASQNPYSDFATNPYAPQQNSQGYFATGGSVGSTISNIQDALTYKPIAPSVEPMLKAAPVSDVGIAKLKPLKHLRQSIAPSSPLSGDTGLARGGLPSKYHEAMPDGHKPEFVTGLTGYYAGGRGTGQSDDIDAMLHDGDYVMDAEAVSALGDGSSKAGKDSLTHFLGQVPHRDGAAGKPVPAKIADGEFVLPESFVTSLGGGDNKRGAKMLDEMRKRLREHKRSAPLSKIPPKAKSPLEYLEGVKG